MKARAPCPFGHGEPEDKANWLPASEGPFRVTMRLYQAKEAAFDSTSQPPAVKRVE